MRGRTIIKKDGELVTEVLDREGTDCKEVVKLTERIGQQIGEQITGDDCDTTHETTYDN